MARTSLAAALALAAVGFGTAAEAKAQYTVYIWNLNRNDGWVRSGVAGTVFTTKQACLNNINTSVAQNKRFRTDWEAFAVVRTT
jgi:ABC-type sugar transport system substrate-binding protein